MFSVEELQKIVNAEMIDRSKELLNHSPLNLYKPVEYSLGIRGKRLRPVLLLLGYNLFADDIEKALPAAMAIETFHNFTLLHDDIMDNAEVRRNQPTVHKKFDTNSAILSGDAMAFLSYRYLLECNTGNISEILELFTKTAVEVCEGQQFDMDFENRTYVTESEYLEMIRLKTAVLLACSIKSGALLANAAKKEADLLYEYGINLGLAFQLQDDLLDTFGNQEMFGKKIGGDILANKKTYLLVKALENSTGNVKKELLEWIHKKDFFPKEKIDAVKNIFTQVNIKEITQQKINFYFQRSTDLLNHLNIDKKTKEPFYSLGNQMLNRKN